jgi:HEAT repeat protein
LRAIRAFLFPHRWQGQLAEAKRLLAADPPSDGAAALAEKIDEWLESPGWEVRNAAVRLIAHLRSEPRYPRLLERLSDHAEAGIVRRTAVESMARLGLRTDGVRSALVAGLADGYWEVRSEAGRTLAALFPPAADLERALLGLLYGPPRGGRRPIREENFEVRMAIAEALGHLGVSRSGFDALADLADDDSWLVRSQAAVALAHFAARQPDYAAEARERLATLDRQSDGAVSYFVHRDVLSQAMAALRRGPGEVAPKEFHDLYLNPKAGWNHVRR